MRFSVAHAGNSVVLALCYAAGIGVDLKGVRQFDDALLVARQQFHPHEYDGWCRCLPPADPQ
jgi:phosphopantetheinyl transferase